MLFITLLSCSCSSQGLSPETKHVDLDLNPYSVWIESRACPALNLRTGKHSKRSSHLQDLLSSCGHWLLCPFLASLVQRAPFVLSFPFCIALYCILLWYSAESFFPPAQHHTTRSMAATGSSYATGAERQAGELRQRGAPELVVNGQSVTLDAEDKKKLQVRANHGQHYARRAYNRSQKQSNSILQLLDEWEFVIAPLIFTALAFFTRMWKIGLSDIVTWDEAQ